MPAMSAVVAASPAMCPAVPSSADTVSTPVPPMPVTMMLNPWPGDGMAGSGTPARSMSPAAFAFLGLAPATVTNDGQKPLRQLKSLLQLDWLIRRLRPNSVSTGSTDRQLD